jgi:aryl-alcohol dehydrogenase-like predicted oxidoreductase
MKLRQIGPFAVAEIGLGCMNLSHAYGAPPPPEQAEALLLDALDQGVTLFDTAALYGFGANETLVGRVLKPHRQRIVLCSKGGMAGVTFPEGVRRVIDGRPQTVRQNCEDSPGAWAPMSSTSTTCTAGTSGCPSRTVSARWRGWCRPARCARWA